MKWQGLKLDKGKATWKYVDNFWGWHLKAINFKKIEFQLYIMDQKTKSILEFTDCLMVTMKIFPTKNFSQARVDKSKKASNKKKAQKHKKRN